MAQGSGAQTSLSWEAVRAAGRWTREQAEWVVSEWRRSGLSVQQFAAQHGVEPHRVYFWRNQSKPEPKKRRLDASRPELVEIQLKGSALPVERQMTVELVNGRRLVVAEHIDLAVLERVVATLER